MRQPLIAGNWKMHLDAARARVLAVEIVKQAASHIVDVVICPPFVYLPTVGDVVRGSSVQLGAQNCHFMDYGPFTGEVSPTMLRDMGCQYAILGHSERRQWFSETDDIIHRKLKAVLTCGMTAIVCVGESLEQRENGETQRVVTEQMAGSVGPIDEEDWPRLVIAYEPIWAIGTGRTATPEQADEVHADLRKWMATRYNSQVAETARIIYGGSVKPENASELLAQPNIDGALVGGASLVADDFLAIVAAANSSLTV